VLALDLRGHGDSARADPPAYAYRDYADDVANFAGALDLRDFVLVGHSMGGMVSLVYAATRPSRMARLVIVDSSMHLSAEGVARLRESGARPPRTYPTREALVERFRLEPPGPKIAAPAIIRHIATMSARELPEGTWTHKFDRSLYAAFERIDGMPYWDSIRVPTLLVKGEFSARLDSRTLARIRSCAPQVEFAVVAQSAHHVMLDNPAGFVQAVTPFLAKP
jgi:pimeloyl-ACP methyl ester carboxylesterase